MEAIRTRFQAAGQGHVLAGWSDLSDLHQSHLLEVLQQVDLEQVRLHADLLQGAKTQKTPRFEPPELFPAHPVGAQAEEAGRARAEGEALLRAGKVGFLLVAGGQGSRLGFEGPKGMFPVGPQTQLSLFAWHAARLRAAQARYGIVTPWYVMTSPSNDAQTRAYFGEQTFFGLNPKSVHFFSQAMIPALDAAGKIVLSGPGEVFLAPNGHGGTLDALRSSGLLEQARAQGIETFSYFQVDNPLARPADPLFLGLHKLRQANMSSKVVAKTNPMEKVGVLGMADGLLGCIEYSDLPEDLRDATDADGELLFRAGNIAVHAIEAEFVQQLTSQGLDLPWHLARKKMPAMDAEGKLQTVDGIKFETFVFDALAQSPRSVTLEVQREVEFSPVKNASGGDSPQTCREHLTGLFDSWCQAAGLDKPPVDDQGASLIEVDPTFAEDTAEFLARQPVQPQASAGGWLFR